MENVYFRKVNPFGLAEAENVLLRKQYPTFEFTDISYDIIEFHKRAAAAVILNPEKISNTEIIDIYEMCYYQPLFIFTNSLERTDFPVGVLFEICDLSDKQRIGKALSFAKRWCLDCYIEEWRYD